MKRTSRRNFAIVAIAALALVHAVVCVGFRLPLLSNLIQLTAALMATCLCLRRAQRSASRYFRWEWSWLAIAFGVWASGQVYDVGYTLTHTTPLSYPNPGDFFWLLYAFPILLLAARTRNQLRDWTSVLDLAQAGISAGLLVACVLYIPGVEIVERAYDIQGVALLFACAIRYLTGGRSEERFFFRNLTVYIVAYDGLGIVTQLVPKRFVVDGGFPDLAFSYPFLIFCAITILSTKVPAFLDWKLPKVILPVHIRGLSSLGLTLTSIASGVVLAVHHARFGLPGVVLACGVFALRTATRESQLQHAQLRLEYDNHHDSLTGLANRTLLLRELERPDKTACLKRALLFLDLDRFKIINDSLGHAFGDRLLIHVADTLCMTVRPDDLVARLGGDEFVVLLNDCPDVAMADAVAQRILARLRTPVQFEGRVVHAAGSIGIATLQEGETASYFLRKADAAMYAAKSMGKNRVRVFDRSILDKAARELEIESDLRRSVEDDAIEVAYQPVYYLRTGALRGFEALARWKHPRYGPIPPDDFIPLAEDAGLIADLGRNILRKACRQAEVWNRRFHARLTVGVNVSGRQLADPQLIRSVNEVLLETGLDPMLLKLEITESVLMTDRQPAREFLDAVRARGVEIYLDDFGKGYSALEYLLEFPFDGIKIDRSFLQDVERDERHATVMATIVKLAQTLDKKVVAEGIETEAQRKFVTGIRCDYAQGFLFARPMPPQGVLQMLEAAGKANGWQLPAASPLAAGDLGSLSQ